MPSLVKPIVVVGSINMDFVANIDRIPEPGETITGTDFQIHSGGKGANQSVAVARLGYPVQLIGKVGLDVFGKQLLDHLASAGVETSAIGMAPGTSGVATIAVAADGENSIIVIPGANALVTPDFLDEHIQLIRGAGVVLAQLEIPLATVLHLANICSEADVPLILDPAPARPLPEGLFRKLAWFTPNETEAAFYMRSDVKSPAELAEGFLARGTRGVILKMGAKGSFLSTHGVSGISIPSFPVRAIDTTAAGDAFNGTFATGLMLGLSVVESAHFASAAAAISVTRKGAQPSMPDRREVEGLLEGRLLESQRRTEESNV